MQAAEIKTSNVNSQTLNCSGLGTFDPTTKSCQCESGWTGPLCNNLNVTPLPDTSASYNNAVFTEDRPTWGGSIIEGDGTYFFVGATFPNSRGLSCWPSTSTAAIWEADQPQGPWKLNSFVGFGNNFPGFKADEVPWNHNSVVTIDKKLSDPTDPNSTIKYALVIYSILQRPKKSKQISKANFGPPNSKICATGWAKRFPVDTIDQESYAGYVELQATNDKDLKKEITTILRSKSLAVNVNGYNRSEYVNTQFSWVNLKSKVTNPPLNMVNPSPLTSYVNNYSPLVADPNGEYYRLLAVRFSTGKEAIGLLKSKADKFIWETNAKYAKGGLISFGWNIEDPFLFESQNGYHLIVHDGRTCGLWNSCGSLTNYPKNTAGYNILADSTWKKPMSGWSTPTKLYNSYIPDLKTLTTYRQRPVIFFRNQKPELLLNGTIFAASNQTSKASRTFTQPIGR